MSPETLGTWERRYGLLEPARSAGGFRLYGAADERRVRQMRAYLAQGVAAREAALLAQRAAPADSASGSITALRDELGRSLEAFDEAESHRILDSALDLFSLDSVITALLIPYLDDLGERWARNEVTVAQEHFAANLIRGRLLALGRSWDAGYGPRALLACPEGELHDLGLVLFGVALGHRGWRITFLGANTPLATVKSTAERLRPDAIVVAATSASYLAGQERVLSHLAGAFRLILAGRATSRWGRTWQNGSIPTLSRPPNVLQRAPKEEPEGASRERSRPAHARGDARNRSTNN